MLLCQTVLLLGRPPSPHCVNDPTCPLRAHLTPASPSAVFLLLQPQRTHTKYAPFSLGSSTDVISTLSTCQVLLRLGRSSRRTEQLAWGDSQGGR